MYIVLFIITKIHSLTSKYTDLLSNYFFAFSHLLHDKLKDELNFTKITNKCINIVAD